jgi:hypothetical protein
MRDQRRLPLSNLYERSVQQRKEKEQKLHALREQLMKDYTFIPDISKSKENRVPTIASSSGGTALDRLHFSGNSGSSLSGEKDALPVDCSSPLSIPQVPFVPANFSPRVETLHTDGVDKLRNRLANDHSEKVQRDGRVEDKELLKLKNSRICMKPAKVHVSTKRRVDSGFPREIIITTSMMSEADSWRQLGACTNGPVGAPVSPLRFTPTKWTNGGFFNTNDSLANSPTEYGSI